jgi:hypothetical protein
VGGEAHVACCQANFKLSGLIYLKEKLHGLELRVPQGMDTNIMHLAMCTSKSNTQSWAVNALVWFGLFDLVRAPTLV